MSACLLPQVNVLEAGVHQVLRGALVYVALGLNLVIVWQTVHLRQVTIIIRPKKKNCVSGLKKLEVGLAPIFFLIYFFIKNWNLIYKDPNEKKRFFR